MARGIRTQYKNYSFRSRLEARWAGFFDELRWKWEYEPTEFNGWIPDFALYGEDIVYVEIKPVVTFPEEVAQKILRSGCDKEVLILGQTVPLPDQSRYEPCIGWLREGHYGENPEKTPVTKESYWFWEKAAFGRWSDGGGAIGFCHTLGSFFDRITGGYDGGSYGNESVSSDEIQRLWASACNKVQWKR